MRLFSKQSILGSFFLLSLTTSASIAMEGRDPDAALGVARAGVADLDAGVAEHEADTAALAASMEDAREKFAALRAEQAATAVETDELKTGVERLNASQARTQDAMDARSAALGDLNGSLQDLDARARANREKLEFLIAIKRDLEEGN